MVGFARPSSRFEQPELTLMPAFEQAFRVNKRSVAVFTWLALFDRWLCLKVMTA